MGAGRSALLAAVVAVVASACGGSSAFASMESAERGSDDTGFSTDDFDLDVDSFDPDSFGPDSFGPDGFEPGTGESGGRVVPPPDPNQPIPGIDTSLQSPAPFGAPREVGDGWTVTVDAFDPSANASVEAASTFYQPPPNGMTYAVATVTGSYTGDAGGGSSMELDFELVGPTGVAYGTDLMCSLPDDWVFLDDTPTGGSTTGTVCFQVPAGEADAMVLVVSPFFRFDGARTFMALR